MPCSAWLQLRGAGARAALTLAYRSHDLSMPGLTLLHRLLRPGMASISLVLSIVVPSVGSWWYLLTLLSPAAWFYYFQKGERTEQVGHGRAGGAAGCTCVHARVLRPSCPAASAAACCTAVVGAVLRALLCCCARGNCACPRYAGCRCASRW